MIPLPRRMAAASPISTFVTRVIPTTAEADDVTPVNPIFIRFAVSVAGTAAADAASASSNVASFTTPMPATATPAFVWLNCRLSASIAWSSRVEIVEGETPASLASSTCGRPTK